MPRFTINEFITRAKIAHGSIYDYSQVNYVNSLTKVDIVCQAHGIFQQRPYEHYNGQGCPQCANDRNRKDNVFINRANKTHGGKYDYSKVVYKRCDQKVIIGCPEHGDWETKPAVHLKHGCPKCSKLLTQDEFLQKAFDVHGPKYNYDKSIFTETRGRVIITCPIHGDFSQVASAHLSGNGCKHCADDKRRMSTEDFIKRAHEVHDGMYDYSTTIYIGSHGRVIIACPIHGDFITKAYNHLQGKRCRKCFYENHPGGYTYEVFKRNQELASSMGVFYIIEYEFPSEHFIKIGITQHSAYFRAKSYWRYATILLETPMTMYEAFCREQEILQRPELLNYKYYSKNLSGGNTECFTLDVKPLLF